MKKPLLLFFFLLTSVYAGAQTAFPQLRIINLYNFPDTAYEGVTYPISINLKNVGTAPFTGPLQVILQTDTAFDILYFSNNPNFALFPNDTVVLAANTGTFGYVFTSQVFRPGNDVVVVWPYSTQFGVQFDSLYTAVHFVPLSGITNDQEVSEWGLTVYPNPFNDVLHLEMASGIVVERVRILDLLGREIYRDEKEEIRLLNLEALRSGIYILEMEAGMKGRVMVKIIKQ